jgi:hypothetical protein
MNEAMRVAQLMPKLGSCTSQDGKAKKEMVIFPVLFNLKNIKQRNIKELEFNIRLSKIKSVKKKICR